MLQHDIVEKNLAEIFNRREYLYNELVRVQKTCLEVDEYIVFAKVLLLVKNAAYLKIAFSSDSNVNIAVGQKMPG